MRLKLVSTIGLLVVCSWGAWGCKQPLSSGAPTSPGNTISNRVSVIGDISLTFPKMPTAGTMDVLLRGGATQLDPNRFVFVIHNFTYRNQDQGLAVEYSMREGAIVRRHQ